MEKDRKAEVAKPERNLAMRGYTISTMEAELMQLRAQMSGLPTDDDAAASEHSLSIVSEGQRSRGDPLAPPLSDSSSSNVQASVNSVAQTVNVMKTENVSQGVNVNRL